MTPIEFRQWRIRMGNLTIQQTADVTGCSFDNVRCYGDGRRTVPKYIVNLCNHLEREKRRSEIEMGKKNRPNTKQTQQQQPAGQQERADGINFPHLLAVAFRQIKAVKSPISAASMSVEMLEQELADALEILSQNGVEISVVAASDQNPS